MQQVPQWADRSPVIAYQSQFCMWLQCPSSFCSVWYTFGQKHRHQQHIASKSPKKVHAVHPSTRTAGAARAPCLILPPLSTIELEHQNAGSRKRHGAGAKPLPCARPTSSDHCDCKSRSPPNNGVSIVAPRGACKYGRGQALCQKADVHMLVTYPGRAAGREGTWVWRDWVPLAVGNHPRYCLTGVVILMSDDRSRSPSRWGIGLGHSCANSCCCSQQHAMQPTH